MASSWMSINYNAIVMVLYLVRPSIIYTSPSRSITENETLTIFCNATGNPSPPIQWFKVNSTESVFPIANQLSIARIKADDKGIYKCVADNGIGRPAVAFIEIDVLGKIR